MIHKYTTTADARLIGGPMHDKVHSFKDGRVLPIELTRELGHGCSVQCIYIPWWLCGEFVWAFETLCANDIIELLKKRDKEVIADIERRHKEAWGPYAPAPAREYKEEKDAGMEDEDGW